MALFLKNAYKDPGIYSSKNELQYLQILKDNWHHHARKTWHFRRKMAFSIAFDWKQMTAFEIFQLYQCYLRDHKALP